MEGLTCHLLLKEQLIFISSGTHNDILICFNYIFAYKLYVLKRLIELKSLHGCVLWAFNILKLLSVNVGNSTEHPSQVIQQQEGKQSQKICGFRVRVKSAYIFFDTEREGEEERLQVEISSIFKTQTSVLSWKWLDLHLIEK